MSAPGDGVRSSVPPNDYATLSGTSMASPHVSGCIALMMSAAPMLEYDEIYEILITTAADLGTPGFDYEYGNGRIDCYEAVSTAITASTPFSIAIDPAGVDACVPNDAVYNINVLQNEAGYTSPVTLSVLGTPTGYTPGFGLNPVAVPGDSVLTLTGGAAAPGSYSLRIVGVSLTNTLTATVGLNLFTAVPLAPALTSPANAATDISLMPTFIWNSVSQAGTYFLQVATDPNFSNVVYDASVATTSHTISGTNLDPETTYYWRVQTLNVCGDSPVSATYRFTTDLQFCISPDAPINDNSTTSSTFRSNWAGAIADLNVYVQIDHTWIRDLDITLTHEGSATSVVLLPAGFSCDSGNGENIDATFDDEAPIPITCGGDVPALSGIVQPDGSLADFDFGQLAGNWRLDVHDSADRDSGTLVQWCLEPQFVAELGNIAGTITDDNTGNPLVADIHGVGPNGFAVTVSGDSYQLAVPAGSYDLTVSANGYLSQTATVTAMAGITVTTDFALQSVPLTTRYIFLPISMKP